MVDSWLPGSVLDGRLHTECPAPCILFEAVRGAGEELCDLEWRALNPAAQALVQELDLERSASRWGERVVGWPELPVLARVVAQGEPHTREVCFRLTSGERWFQATAVRREDGLALWLFDVTGERAAQQRLREALEQERAARAHAEEALAVYEGLEREAPVGIALLDLDLRHRHLNPMLARLEGLSPETALGRPLSPAVAPVLGPLCRQALERDMTVMQELSPQGWLGPAVEGIWQGVAFPVHREGRCIGVGLVLIDITERKRALERMAEEARFRERFIGILGHDLRSPLNAVALSARFLRRRSPLNATQQQLIERIEASAARMGNMISDILDFARARLSGGIPLNLTPTRLPEVCRQVLDELSVIHPDRFVAFEAQGECQGVWDPGRLAQVLSNLVGNALEHGLPDEPIMLRCVEEEDQQLLEVCNLGALIPSSQLATLFDPFRQAGGPRGRRSGLGLGLFIVREIVEAHGGSVRVSSSAQEGTTFTVLLPRDARQAWEGRGAQEQAQSA